MPTFFLALTLLYSMGVVVAGLVWGSTLWTSLYIFFLSIGSVIYLIRYHYRRKSFVFSIRKNAVLFYMLVIVPAISIGLQHFLQDVEIDLYGRSSQRYVVNTYVVSVLWLLCGAAMVGARAVASNRISISISFILLVAVLIFLESGLSTRYHLANDGLSGQFSHLTVGDPVAFLVIFSYTLSRGGGKFAALSIGMIVLFALGGRAAFFILPIAIAIYEVVFNRNISRVAIVSLAAFGVLLFFLSFSGTLLQDEFSTRMVLLEGLAQDASFLGRVNQFYQGLEDLLAQAPIGNPSLMVRRSGSLGNYIHNILSAWQFFGLLFFVLLIYVIRSCLSTAWEFREDGREIVVSSFVILLIYVTISVVIAKAVTFTLLWVALGYWLGFGDRRVMVRRVG